MANIIVKDAAGLTAALKSAQSGDTIKLASGDYGALNLSGIKFSGAGRPRLDSPRGGPQGRAMEPYSLLIIFLAMVAVWFFTWAPWKKRPSDELPQAPQDRPDEDPGRQG